MWLLALLLLLGGACLLSSEARSTTTRALPKTGESAAEHGRTANCKGGTFTSIMRSVFRVTASIVAQAATSFTAGIGKSELQSLAKDLSAQTKELEGEQFNTWINGASNEEITVWAFSLAQRQVDFGIRQKKAPPYLRKSYEMLGFTEAVWNKASAGEQLEWTLRLFLFMVAAPLALPPCRALHGIQGVAAACYGGKGAIALVNERLKTRPKGGAPFFQWINDTVKALGAYRDAQLKKP